MPEDTKGAPSSGAGLPTTRSARRAAGRPERVDVSEYREVNVKITNVDGNKVPHPHVPQDENGQVVDLSKRLLFPCRETSDQEKNDDIASTTAMAPGWPADPSVMLLDDFNDAALFDYVVKRAEDSPALDGMLSARYAKAVAPEVEPDPASLLPPPLALPEAAPRLWADRDKGTKAAQFVRETYAPWIEAGVLTRGALKACDKALYHAYHVWVHRHPEDAVPFKDAPPAHFIVDPAEAIERVRAGARASYARTKSRQDNMSRSPT